MEASEQIAKIYRTNDQYDSVIEWIDVETQFSINACWLQDDGRLNW